VHHCWYNFVLGVYPADGKSPERVAAKGVEGVRQSIELVEISFDLHANNCWSYLGCFWGYPRNSFYHGLFYYTPQTLQALEKAEKFESLGSMEQILDWRNMVNRGPYTYQKTVASQDASRLGSQAATCLLSPQDAL
jgi:hypothetical protein